jgi:hypothetical protein
VAESSPTRARQDLRTDPPSSIAGLIAAGTLDAELAATVWLLAEARVPVLVAGTDDDDGRTSLLAAVVAFLPADLRVVEVRVADETYDWLPQASELGWPGVARRPAAGRPPARPEDTVLIVPELSGRAPAGAWGDIVRVAIRAASIGYGLMATVEGATLDDVFAGLRASPVRVGDDELSRLGVVLVLGRAGIRGGGRVVTARRVVAAHYVRPVSRDVHGHLQRLGPAVLATWDAATDRFEHFGWGVLPELAARVGRRAGDFEIEAATRRGFLDALVAGGTTEPGAVRAALADYRAWAAADPPVPASGRAAPAVH